MRLPEEESYTHYFRMNYSPKAQPEKIRIELDYSPDSFEKLEKIKDIKGISSWSDFFFYCAVNTVNKEKYT